MSHARLVRTDIELFDLPEGAVIRTIASGRVGELTGEHVSDLHEWDFDSNGDRTLSRSIAWTGSDIDTYEHYHDLIAGFLPAEVIYLPESATEAAI